MTDTIELSGDDILDMLSEQIIKDYGGEIIDKWFERENETGEVWAAFVLKDKIGAIKIKIDNGIQ